MLTINNTTDYESQQQYDIVVRVSDGSLDTDQSFEVVVNNLNDNSPIISFPNSMDENDNELGNVSIIDYDYNSQLEVCIFQMFILFSLEHQNH